jgi:hypothetical protein
MADDLAAVKRLIQRAALETAHRVGRSRALIEEARKALQRPVWKGGVSDQSRPSSNVVPLQPLLEDKSVA